MEAEMGSRGIAPLILNVGRRCGGGCSVPRFGCFTPGKAARYQLYRSVGGCQGRSGRVRRAENLLALPVFESRTACAASSLVLVPDSNLGPQIDRCSWGVLWHSSTSRGKWYSTPRVLLQPFPGMKLVGTGGGGDEVQPPRAAESKGQQTERQN
jgi:hypothetical protein